MRSPMSSRRRSRAAARRASASRSRAGSAATCASCASDTLLADDSLFRREAVERLLAEHTSGAADHGHRLWCLVMLALWQKAHLT